MSRLPPFWWIFFRDSFWCLPTEPRAVEETKNAIRMTQNRGPPQAKITVPTTTPAAAPPGIKRSAPEDHQRRRGVQGKPDSEQSGKLR